MLCSLCTIDVLRGTMFRTHEHARQFRSSSARLAIPSSATPRSEIVCEELCACEKVAAWFCESGCVSPALPPA